MKAGMLRTTRSSGSWELSGRSRKYAHVWSGADHRLAASSILEMLLHSFGSASLPAGASTVHTRTYSRDRPLSLKPPRGDGLAGRPLRIWPVGTWRGFGASRSGVEGIRGASGRSAGLVAVFGGRGDRAGAGGVVCWTAAGWPARSGGGGERSKAGEGVVEVVLPGPAGGQVQRPAGGTDDLAGCAEQFGPAQQVVRRR